MRLTLTRLDQRRYQTLIARDDGVRFLLPGAGHMFALPHDLAHFVVEQGSSLDRGFWGSIAEGAVIKQMVYLDGRRKPHAVARSKAVLKANAAHLTAAEALVRIFNEAIEGGGCESSRGLRARLAERRIPRGETARDIGDAGIAAVFAAWQAMLSRWRDLPVGGVLDLHWSAPRPARHRRGDPGRASMNAAWLER